jgi:glycosyltransferase involved in cell wall biosynthesis
MRLSIITINKNNASGLRRTLDSVARQSRPPFECIVIDGGSTDESLSVAHEHRNRVTMLISEPDRGVFDAMNKGWRMAHGDWLLYLNSGDCFAESDVIETLESEASEGVCVVYGDYRDASGRVFRTSMDSGIFNHQAIAYRKSLHEAFGPYFVHLGVTISDYLFFMNVAASHAARKVDRVLAVCDLEGISSKSNHLYQRAACDLILGRLSPRYVGLVLLAYPVYKAVKQLLRRARA